MSTELTKKMEIKMGAEGKIFYIENQPAPVDFCLIDENSQRMEQWAIYYFNKNGRMPNHQMQEAYVSLMKSKQIQDLIALEALKKQGMTEEQAKEMLEKNLKENDQMKIEEQVNKEIVNSVSQELAHEVAQKLAHHCAENGISQGSNAISVGLLLMAGHLPELATNVAGIFGSVITEAAVEHFVEPENKQIEFGAGIVGGAAASAGFGAIFGGPIGAIAVGGGAIAGGFLMEGIQTSVQNYGEGPTDNHVYCEAGPYQFSNTEQLCFGTYNRSTKSYFKTYLNHLPNDNEEFKISAGQKKDEHFQVSIWHRFDENNKWQCIQHFNKVFYNDFIRVLRTGAQEYTIVHCNGENHGVSGGTTVLAKYDASADTPVDLEISPCYFGVYMEDIETRRNSQDDVLRQNSKEMKIDFKQIQEEQMVELVQDYDMIFKDDFEISDKDEDEFEILDENEFEEKATDYLRIDESVPIQTNNKFSDIQFSVAEENYDIFKTDIAEADAKMKKFEVQEDDLNDQELYLFKAKKVEVVKIEQEEDDFEILDQDDDFNPFYHCS